MPNNSSPSGYQNIFGHIFLQITTLLDTMMKEVGDVKEAAEGISELKRKLAEVF